LETNFIQFNVHWVYFAFSKLTQAMVLPAIFLHTIKSPLSSFSKNVISFLQALPPICVPFVQPLLVVQLENQSHILQIIIPYFLISIFLSVHYYCVTSSSMA
jgi:hypothetical protein